MGHPRAVDLSDAVLWYWQMTGNVWYSTCEDSRERALSLSEAHVSKYALHVKAWKDLVGELPPRRKGKGKRKVCS